MNQTEIQKLLQEANDCVPRLSFEEANNIILEKNTLIIDVRETAEIEATGLIKNAVNIPKSMIDTNFDHSLIGSSK
jgi:rhodanese-related sulfurtransferase